jgi:DNA invertase Pin-like site-specific DNA recombinase
MSPKKSPSPVNVVAIVRVSEYHDGKSPEEQEAKIKAACEANGKNLVAVHRELDVSGGRALSKRPGLRAAVEAIESGEAQEIMAAYFDRLFRSLKTQAETLERVERAGGKVLALDVGAISEDTAAQWMQASTLGMMSEYYRRSTRERTEPTRERMVAEGKLIWDRVPLGILLDSERRMSIDESLRETIAEAFAIRANGASKGAVRAYLDEQGHRLTIRQIDGLLAQPLYMGTYRFGEGRVNRQPFGPGVEPIVDGATWERVQAMRTPSGRKGKSERLLARLDVLRCGSCGSRMVVGRHTYEHTAKDGTVTRRDCPFYKCGHNTECSGMVAIAAERIEDYVSERVKTILADAEASESALREAAEAQRAADAAARAYKRARRRAMLLDEEAGDDEVVEMLAHLRDRRDESAALATELARESDLAESVNAARDWDRLTVAERRELIALALESVTVSRATSKRAPVESRVVVKPRRKQTTSRAA